MPSKRSHSGRGGCGDRTYELEDRELYSVCTYGVWGQVSEFRADLDQMKEQGHVYKVEELKRGEYRVWLKGREYPKLRNPYADPRG